VFKIGASLGRMVGEAMHLWFPQGIHYGSSVAPIIPGNSSATHRPVVKAVRLQVLMAVSMKVIVFWDVAPCSLTEVDWRFRGAYCLHHQGGA
jgi:chloride channel 2